MLPPPWGGLERVGEGPCGPEVGSTKGLSIPPCIQKFVELLSQLPSSCDTQTTLLPTLHTWVGWVSWALQGAG